MKSLLALPAALLVLSAQAADAPARRPISISLEPAKVHEECMRLEAGEKRQFSWKSNAAVDFNIHYHEGPEVFFPVKRDGTRGERGTFTAKVAQDFCWMWTARKAPATIGGRIEPAQ